jgi:hypothetical protein
MSVAKKILFYISIFFITIGALSLKDQIFPKKTSDVSAAASEDANSLKSDNLKIIPAAKILYEYEKNKLRAIEKYGNEPSKIVAVFHEVQNDKYESGNSILITMMESWESGLMYAILPQSQRKNLIETDNGTLISINCIGLDKYGSSPLFKKCDLLEKVDTKGERPKIYLDKLVWENNDLVNAK